MTLQLEKTVVPGVSRLPDGRYVAVASIKDAEGRQHKARRVMPEGTRLTEAAAMMGELRKTLLAAPQETPLLRPSDTSQTFEAYATRWLALRAQRLKPSANRTYLAALEQKILPRLGWLQCADVTREAIESWVVWIEASRMPTGKSSGKKGIRQPRGEVQGKKYSHDSMRQWWRVLRTVCKDMAADMRLADATARVRPPERPDQDPVREQQTLDEQGLGQLLDAAAVHCPDRAPEIAVMALTGMRAGEVYGLMWDCVNFDRRIITLRRSISDGILQETTKTKARRTVPMHAILVEILQTHRQKLISEQHPGLASGMVFPADTGGLRLPSSAQKAWRQLRKVLNTDVRVGPQVVRRSVNTSLLLAGVDRITLRSIMGHTSEAMTARYAGVGMDVKAAAVDGLRIVPKVPADEAG